MKLDIKYIAGFFDGEGSVSIAHTPNGSKSGRRQFRLLVGIAQKSRPVLDAIQEKFKGTVHLRKTLHGVHQLQLNERQAEAFLKAIRKHVIIKRDVVDLALEYRKLVGIKVGRVTPPHIVAEKMRIRNEVMRLNRIT